MELLKIIKYLDKKFDPKFAAEWDSIGFQFLSAKYSINPTDEVANVIVCMDVTKEVVKEAINSKSELIISRHPFIFGELANEKLNPAKKEMIKSLIANNIKIYSIHTNYDASPNQALGEILNSILHINSLSKSGKNKEALKIKLKSNISLKELFKIFNESFKTNSVVVSRNWNDVESFKEFHLVSGAGGGTMISQKLENTVFITGEMKWNEWIYAQDNNVRVLGLGHYMENYFVNDLVDKLSNSFKEINIHMFDIKNQIRKEQ